MQKCIAIQANSVDRINVETDTSLLLALEAQKRSYQIYWYETKDLSLANGKIYAKAKKVVFFEKTHRLLHHKTRTFSDESGIHDQTYYFSYVFSFQQNRENYSILHI